MEDLNRKFELQVGDLERELEEKERDHETTIEDIH